MPKLRKHYALTQVNSEQKLANSRAYYNELHNIISGPLIQHIVRKPQCAQFNIAKSQRDAIKIICVLNIDEVVSEPLHM